MPSLNSGFINDTHYMDDSAATGLNMGATVTTSKTYLGIPGKPVGGFCLDKGIRYCIQSFWTGTSAPAGTLTFNGSNDNVNWTPITGASQAVSGAGNFLWRDTCDYKYVQAVYTRTSGGATDTITHTIKLTTRGDL